MTDMFKTDFTKFKAWLFMTQQLDTEYSLEGGWGNTKLLLFVLVSLMLSNFSFEGGLVVMAARETERSIFNAVDLQFPNKSKTSLTLTRHKAFNSLCYSLHWSDWCCVKY